MKRVILLIIIVIGIISCNDTLTKAQVASQIVNQKTTPIINSPDNVRFDFKATNMVNFKKTIEINATLINDNLDTIYFLTSSCDGMQYSLEYDTTKLFLTPFMNCNANFPMIGKIPPKGKLDFDAHFSFSEKVTSINLGFDFYRIDKSFHLTKIKLHDVYCRPGNVKNIKWADTRSVQQQLRPTVGLLQAGRTLEQWSFYRCCASFGLDLHCWAFVCQLVLLYL